MIAGHPRGACAFPLEEGLPPLAGVGSLTSRTGRDAVRIGHTKTALPLRSADRTRSPAAVSQKREFFKCPPKTIGCFAPEPTKFEVWRHIKISQKPAVRGPF